MGRANTQTNAAAAAEAGKAESPSGGRSKMRPTSGGRAAEEEEGWSEGGEGRYFYDVHKMLKFPHLEYKEENII